MATPNFVSVPLVLNDEEKIQENKVILLWSISVCLVVLNTTMFNIALPSILRDLSLNSSSASWVVSGYSIVFAISTLTYSRLSDYLPLSRLILIGSILLGSSSIIGFFVQDYYSLLIIRILQAAGAGAIPGLGMVLTGKYIPLIRRGKAMASIASAASLGFGLGPVIGGAITQFLGWNYLFLITSFILFFIPMFQKLLPVESSQTVNFDIGGGVLTGMSVVGLLLFLSTFSFAIFIGTSIVIMIMWKHLQRVKMPFIQPELIRNKQYVKLILIAFSAYFTHFATLFMVPIILSSYFHKAPAVVGLLIFPGAILSALGARFIGKMIDTVGNRPLINLSLGALLTSTILFALLSYHSPAYILGAYMFMSLGFSGINSSVSNETSRILTKEKLGGGLGFGQLVQFFGGGFGVTVAGLLLSLQKGLPPEMVYRNLFMGLTFILICSGVTAISYFSKKKE
jgi:MFS transporter, DHA2 family, metal-tetracycline-proton antiporter